ncbi:MAG: LPS assembly lipoprotein LptE [Pseudomonadota bacterium]|nr:LPS assembly lipoprotein LptE [Pseudomonadota bacterium]MEC8955588.1 LPS assembly lipoprotein LptE [Pseudomonadota bacterium]
MSLSNKINLIFVLFWVTSCGFELKRAVVLPERMINTYIETIDSRSIFYRKFRNALNSNNIQLVDSKSSATAVLEIIADETGRRVLSVSARNIATEYEVFYRVVYSFGDHEKLLISPQELVLTRSYTFNEKLVLGKSQEEEMLIEALADDLVRMVINQIASQ